MNRGTATKCCIPSSLHIRGKHTRDNEPTGPVQNVADQNPVQLDSNEPQDQREENSDNEEPAFEARCRYILSCNFVASYQDCRIFSGMM